MVASLYGRSEQVTKRHRFNPRRKQHYLRWAAPFNKRIAGQIAALSGTIYHLWHSEMKDRNYRDRYKLLENFDPYSDIQIGNNADGNGQNQTSNLKNN
jgi:hypothetical protein